MMKEKPKKLNAMGERFRHEKYIFEQAKLYMVEVYKYDKEAKMDDIVQEIRGALSRTWGWVGKE